MLRGGHGSLVGLWSRTRGRRVAVVQGTNSEYAGLEFVTLTTRLPRPQKGCFKAAFTPRLSASSVERLANQKFHFARDEVSDWLDADSLGVNAAYEWTSLIHPRVELELKFD
ncbi:hypothetical protein TNCV_3498231 [Trichonephila clavipes]|nr:hypothetical protein TNCV_3498231 [Trichonephila clavipes]